MSASSTVLLASRHQVKCVESDSDSDEERYQRNQERLLQKVERSAAAIRKLTEITRPFVTGSWRLEREEQRFEKLRKFNPAEKPSFTPPRKTSEQRSSTSKKGNDPLDQSRSLNESSTKGSVNLKKKVLWSPVKHIKPAAVKKVLEMEKGNDWRPLRKSKVRLLQAFDMENSCNASSVGDDDTSSSCQPLPACTTPSKPTPKPSEEHRTPLRTVVSLNQSLERRASISQGVSNDVAPVATCLSDEPSQEVQAVLTDSEVHCLPSNASSESGEPIVKSSESTVIQNETYLESPMHKTPRALKSYKSPVRCSPILLQAYGKEHAFVRGSICSPEKVVNLDECRSPKDPSKVLKDVVAYVEVRRNEDDLTSGFRWKLKQLGATVSDTLNKKVTHVVFQEGLLSSFRKAKQLGAFIVSTHWVMACDETFSKVDEAKYPIEKLPEYELADPHIRSLKRPKVMSPDLGSGRDEKRLSRRLKAMERRSMRVETPLARTSFSAVASVDVPKSTTPELKFLEPSPKRLMKPRSDIYDDDYDGFLAMVEAQVREKAKSQVNSGEMNVDFETKLQQYLGNKIEGKPDGSTSLPLASIFKKDKSPNAEKHKVSPKEMKKTKPAAQCTTSSASSTVMMKWLENRSPESRALTPVSASDAADEIIKNMFKRIQDDQSAKFNNETKPLKNNLNCEDTKQRAHTARTEHASSKDSAHCEPLFVFTARAGKSKPAETAKKQGKKSKMNLKGSAASSGMMRNWLSGAKSPTPQIPSKPEHEKNLSKMAQPSSSGSCDLTEIFQKKRKANISFDPNDDHVNSSDSIDDLNPRKKHCKVGLDQTMKDGGLESKLEIPFRNVSSPMKVSSSQMSLQGISPKKKGSPSKAATCGSPATSAKKETPRRRSMRVTPMKTAILSNNFTDLGTLQEGKVYGQEDIETPGNSSLRNSKDDVSENAEQTFRRQTSDSSERGSVTKRRTPKATSSQKRLSLHSPNLNENQTVRRLDYV